MLSIKYRVMALNNLTQNTTNKKPPIYPTIKPFQQTTMLNLPSPIFISNIDNDIIVINEIIQSYATQMQNNINNDIPFLQVENIEYYIGNRSSMIGIYLQNLNGTCYVVSSFLFEKYIIAKMMEIIKRPYVWSYITMKHEIKVEKENIVQKGFYQVQVVIFPY